MHAMQVVAHPVVTEKIRTVLGACRHDQSPSDYARKLLENLTNITNSQHAVWLSWPIGPGCVVVAETGGVNPLARCLILNRCLPLLVNDPNLCEGIRSVAAAPVRFRTS